MTITLLAAIYFGGLAFVMHYFYNDNTGVNDNILSYGAELILFVTLSSVCFSEFAKKLFKKCTTTKYMLVAALVSVVETVPLPFCRQIFPMYNNFASKSYFIKSWVYTAIIIAAVLLLIVGINNFRKKYQLKLHIEKRQ